MEIVEDYDRDTYRAVYTVQFSDVVCVLHAFQKKSRSGTATPRHDIDLIKSVYDTPKNSIVRNCFSLW